MSSPSGQWGRDGENDDQIQSLQGGWGGREVRRLSQWGSILLKEKRVAPRKKDVESVPAKKMQTSRVERQRGMNAAKTWGGGDLKKGHLGNLSCGAIGKKKGLGVH